MKNQGSFDKKKMKEKLVLSFYFHKGQLGFLNSLAACVCMDDCVLCLVLMKSQLLQSINMVLLPLELVKQLLQVDLPQFLHLTEKLIRAYLIHNLIICQLATILMSQSEIVTGFEVRSIFISNKKNAVNFWCKL